MLSCSAMYAQIQRNILGCKLGVSSVKFVEDELKRRGLFGYRIKEYVVYGQYGQVEFGGVVWDLVSFNFRDGLLKYVNFTKQTYTSSDYLYKNLMSALEKKYSQYKSSMDDDAESHCVVYEDKNARIFLCFSGSINTGNGHLLLKYVDKTYKRTKNKGYDDL